MKYTNKNFYNYLNSLFIIPLLASNLITSNLSQNKYLASAFNLESKEMAVLLDQEIDIRHKKIDEYFNTHDLPLSGFGEKMVIESDIYGLDWRLIPAIAMRESTGGKHACKKATFNPFGWGSCKINFDSYDHSIEILALNLSGNNPKTSHYYKDKDIRGILETYNPPSVVPKYADQVMKIMEEIDGIEI